jgi:hypothetical protein
MKRRSYTVIAFALWALSFSLMASESVVGAQASNRYVADSGMVTLGPNETFRVTVAPSAMRRRVTTITVTFEPVVTFSTCSNGVCTHTVLSDTTTDPVTLHDGQAASYDITQPSEGSAVRIRVHSDSQDMLVNGMVIDNTTGQFRGTFNFRINPEG